MPEPTKLDLGEKFQRAMIKLAVVDASWLSANREFLSPEFMDSVERQAIVRLLVEFYDSNDVAPGKDVLRELIVRSASKKDQKPLQEALLAEFKAIGQTEIGRDTAAFVTQAVSTFAKRHNYMDTVLGAAEDLQKGDLDAARARFDRAAAFGDQGASAGSEIRYFEDDTIDELADMESELLDKVPTLWPHIDELNRGGPSRKELWFLLAPTNRGKSVGLVNLGTNALFTGNSVTHVTLEMSAKKVAYRYNMRLAGMSREEIIAKPEAFKDRVRRFRDMYKGSLIIREYPSRTATPGTIDSLIGTLARRHGHHTDVLVLDYLDECKRPNRDNEAYALGEVTAAIRAIAIRRNLLGWSATQTTRAGLNKSNFDMDDVGDSWEKMKICDGVIAQCQTQEEYESHIMRFVQIKNRDGRKTYRPVFMKVDLDRMTISEMGVKEPHP